MGELPIWINIKSVGYLLRSVAHFGSYICSLCAQVSAPIHFCSCERGLQNGMEIAVYPTYFKCLFTSFILILTTLTLNCNGLLKAVTHFTCTHDHMRKIPFTSWVLMVSSKELKDYYKIYNMIPCEQLVISFRIAPICICFNPFGILNIVLSPLKVIFWHWPPWSIQWIV